MSYLTRNAIYIIPLGVIQKEYEWLKAIVFRNRIDKYDSTLHEDLHWYITEYWRKDITEYASLTIPVDVDENYLVDEREDFLNQFYVWLENKEHELCRQYNYNVNFIYRFISNGYYHILDATPISFIPSNIVHDIYFRLSTMNPQERQYD